MACKLISLLLLIVAATCVVAQYGHGYGGSSGGSSGGSGGSDGYGHGYQHYRQEPYDPHPHYTFHYGVHDTHTHDIKSHKEERKGDVVHGSYDLVEPDGTKRVVEYTADHHTGFNAIVHREHNQHPTHYATPHYEHQSYHSTPSHY